MLCPCILLLLVVLGIVGIIIYSTLNPSQDSFAVPDEAKPPTEEEIKKATSDDERRLYDVNIRRSLKWIIARVGEWEARDDNTVVIFKKYERLYMIK